MPAGLTIFNTSSTVQVDESFKNLSFRERRAIAVNYVFGGQFFDIVIPGQSVVVGIQIAFFTPVLLSVTFDGANWTYRYRFEILAYSHVTSDTAYLYIFDTPPENFENFGLEVYNESGQLTFQNNIRPFKAVSIQQHATAYTGTEGRIFVPVILQASIWPEYSAPLNKFYDHTYALLSSGNAIWPVKVTMQQGFVGYGNPGLYAAVDVTGFT